MDFIEQIDSDTLKDVYRYWDAKRGDRWAPSRDDVDPIEMGPFLQYVFLLDVAKEPGRYWFRLMGTHFTEQYGEDITGRFADEVDFGEARDRVLASFDEVVARREPSKTVGEYTKTDGRMMRFERIALPLSSDGEKVDMMICGIISMYLNR